MANAALFLASQHNPDNPARIEDAAVAIMNRWLNDEGKDYVRTYQGIAYGKIKSPVDSPTNLPWGKSTLHASGSGAVPVESITNVIIEQTTADCLVNQSEAADSLLHILDFVTSKWGQHGLVWFVAAKDSVISKELKRLNISAEQNKTEQNKIKRLVARITDEIKRHFQKD